MQELLTFFVRNSKWFLLALYTTLSCWLLMSHNPYQHHVFLTSAGAVASSVYNVQSGVSSYFDLREINEDLNSRNAVLQREILALRSQLQRMNEQLQADTMHLFEPVSNFDFVVAHVIKNSIARPHNYITINRGSDDGILPEMGVIDQNGVVGIVNVVDRHSARLISLLNPDFRLSCKIKGSDNFGSLVWDGADPTVAMLEELPRHTVYHAGDTIVTSGYSAVFPEGLPVGYVIADGKTHNENFFTLKVRLATDFTTLSNVQVVLNKQRAELDSLEKADRKSDPTAL
ncbi:MAG: rod shape-determining protein MreC [Muribaculaceae bacterium]